MPRGVGKLRNLYLTGFMGTGKTVVGRLSADRLGLEYRDDREFGTAAGYALSVMKKLPLEGESFVDQGWSFEVVDMDNRRIDKILVKRVADEPAED